MRDPQNFNKKKERINVDLFSSTILTCSKHTIWLFTFNNNIPLNLSIGSAFP